MHFDSASSEPLIASASRNRTPVDCDFLIRSPADSTREYSCCDYCLAVRRECLRQRECRGEALPARSTMVSSADVTVVSTVWSTLAEPRGLRRTARERNKQTHTIVSAARRAVWLAQTERLTGACAARRRACKCTAARLSVSAA
jgi:hypothetical protein